MLKCLVAGKNWWMVNLGLNKHPCILRTRWMGPSPRLNQLFFLSFSGEESDESGMFLFSFDLVFVKSMLLSKCWWRGLYRDSARRHLCSFWQFPSCHHWGTYSLVRVGREVPWLCEVPRRGRRTMTMSLSSSYVWAKISELTVTLNPQNPWPSY